MFIYFQALWNLSYANDIIELVALKARPPSSAFEILQNSNEHHYMCVEIRFVEIRFLEIKLGTLMMKLYYCTVA